MADQEICWAFFKLLVSLPLVLLLAYILLRFLPGRKKALPGSKRRMRLLEQLWLSPKTAVCLVEVGGNYLLIAKQEEGVTLLKELDGLPSLLEEEENLRASSFGQVLAGSLFKRSKDNPGVPTSPPGSGHPAPLSLFNLHFIKEHNRGKGNK